MSADATLLAANETAWERANSTVSERILNAPASLILQERDPVACDAQFVAPLAWERSVHFWDPAADAENRARIAASFTDHLGYGAPAALEAEIALDTGLSVSVREFWEVPGLVWPDFLVDVHIQPGVQPPLAPVWKSALRRKPVRDVLVNVRYAAAQPAAALAVVAACHVTQRATILPLGAPKPPPAFVAGAALRVFVYPKILPLKSS